MQALLLWFIVTVIFITVSCRICDLFEEAMTLHCATSLVAYVDLQKPVLHPSLSEIDKLCHQYNKYRLCTAGIRPDCRRSRVSNIEMIYETMCEENYLKLVREEKDCMLQLESDEKLRECFVNQTNVLRDEYQENAFYDGKYSVKIPNVTLPSYECAIIQTFVDCLLIREDKTCNDAVKIEVAILSQLAIRGANDCVLKTNVTRGRPELKEIPIEDCDQIGNCICRLKGYYYDNTKKKCIDVDECSSLSAGCSQICFNLPGSYECSCDSMYFYLDLNNNKTCIRRNKNPLWLFFAHGQSIWNISTDGKSFQLQRAGLQKTAMLDIDVLERRLYYADIGANAIERMNIDGTFPQIVQRFEVDGLEGIAVDWIGRNLYSLRRRDILVQTLEGRFRRILYANVMRLPRAIVVHPKIGQIFVSDWSSSAFIAAASMDGLSFHKIITQRITWPNALAVDIYAAKIYWADAFLDVIEVANLDGSGRRIVIADSGSIPHIFGMAVADDFLYWTDWTYRGLLRANKLTGDNITVLAQTALLPYSLKIFHQSLQPSVDSSPCTNLGCMQLCLLGLNQSAVCACGEGFDLDEDEKTCKSNCSEEHVECGGVDPRCISKLYWCDGVSHCSNHADESNCPPRICLPGQFQCHDNKKCVSPGGLCDGVDDCIDSSDEVFCTEK